MKGNVIENAVFLNRETIAYFGQRSLFETTKIYKDRILFFQHSSDTLFMAILPESEKLQ